RKTKEDHRNGLRGRQVHAGCSQALCHPYRPGGRTKNDTLVSLQLCRRHFLHSDSVITCRLGAKKWDTPLSGPTGNRLYLVRQIEVSVEFRLWTTNAAHQMENRRGVVIGEQASRAVRVVTQRRPAMPRREEIRIETADTGADRSFRPGPTQASGGERRFGLRISHLHTRRETVVTPATTANILDQAAIVEGTEEGKRVFLAVFFAHEQQRQVRRQQHQTGGEPLFRGTNQRGEAIAVRPIADVIVVLDADDEAITGQIFIRSAPAPVAVGTVNAIEMKGVFQHTVETLDIAEIAILAMPFAGEVGMKRVVKIFVPFGIESVSAILRRTYHAHVIHQTFRDDMYRPADTRVGDLLDFAKQMTRARVMDGVDRVEPQTIEMIIRDPQTN